jgi:hypothetical protein
MNLLGESGNNGSRFTLMNRLHPSISGRRMDRIVFWLRASYWTGAIAVLAAALQMIIPGLSPFQRKAESPDSLPMAGFFLLGWSLLLIWAGRRPKERKGVLLLTLCPVLIAWVAAETFAVVFPGPYFNARLLLWALQGGLSFLCTFSYFQARRAYPKWWSQRA